jgi:hypothetical protein
LQAVDTLSRETACASMGMQLRYHLLIHIVHSSNEIVTVQFFLKKSGMEIWWLSSNILLLIFSLLIFPHRFWISIVTVCRSG